MTPEEQENRPRLVPGSSAGHVESYFLKANDPALRRAVWIKFTVLQPKGNPAGALAEVWAILFDAERGRRWAAKESYPLAAARLQSEPFLFQAGPCRLETGRTEGELLAGATTIRWDLRFTTTSLLHRPFPWRVMYVAKVPKSKLVSPYPDERFDGSVQVGDERFAVGGWPGMQGHNWGREHAYAYAWCHCNVLGAPSSFFEGVSARVKLGPVKTPWLTLATLALEGRRIHFDGPAQMLARGIDVGRYYWRFALRGPHASLEGEIRANRDDMVGLTYHNPSGPVTYCLNSKLADLRLVLTEAGQPARALSSKAAALELGTRDPEHGVRMVL